MKAAIRSVICSSLLAVSLFAPLVQADTNNYQGWWWDHNQDGMGYNVDQAGDTIVFLWYHYDDKGQPTWLLLTDKIDGDGNLESRFEKSTGSPAGPDYSSDQRVPTEAGDGWFSFVTVDSDSAIVFSYQLDDGSQGTSLLERFPFGDPNVRGRYQGLWWDPAQDGMGVTFGQEADTIVLTWYHYDDEGNPTWLLLTGQIDGDGVLEGKLVKSFHTQENAETEESQDSSRSRPGSNYSSENLKREEVGTGRVESIDENSALFSYELDNGTRGELQLVRFFQ
jgi:hypothetical protein